MAPFTIYLKGGSDTQEGRRTRCGLAPLRDDLQAVRLVDVGGFEPGVRNGLTCPENTVPDAELVFLMCPLADRDDVFPCLDGEDAADTENVTEVAVRALVEAPGEADPGLDRQDLALLMNLGVPAGHVLVPSIG